MRDSPESFSRTRSKRGSATLRMLIAHAEAHEAPDDHVLARLGRQVGAQLLDGLPVVAVGVDVRLVEQHVLLEPLAPAPLGDPGADVLGLGGGWLLVAPPLALLSLVGDLVLGDELRRCRRDVRGHRPREGHEVLVAGDEVGLAVDLDQGADAVVVVDVGLNRALGGHPLAALGGGGLALDPENLDRLLEVALGLGEGRLAVHHPRACAVAQGLDVGGADRGGAHGVGSWGDGACSGGAWAGVSRGGVSSGGASLASCSEVCAVGCGLSPTSCLPSWSSRAAAIVGSPTASWLRRSRCCSAAATCVSACWRS